MLRAKVVTFTRQFFFFFEENLVTLNDVWSLAERMLGTLFTPLAPVTALQSIIHVADRVIHPKCCCDHVMPCLTACGVFPSLKKV